MNERALCDDSLRLLQVCDTAELLWDNQAYCKKTFFFMLLLIIAISYYYFRFWKQNKWFLKELCAGKRQIRCSETFLYDFELTYLI